MCDSSSGLPAMQWAPELQPNPILKEDPLLLSSPSPWLGTHSPALAGKEVGVLLRGTCPCPLFSAPLHSSPLPPSPAQRRPDVD